MGVGLASRSFLFHPNFAPYISFLFQIFKTNSSRHSGGMQPLKAWLSCRSM